MSNATYLFFYMIQWIALLLLSAVVWTLARNVGMLHTRLGRGGARMSNRGPDLGVVVPKIVVKVLSGRDVIIGGPTDKRTLLLFLSPGCTTCGDIAPALLSIWKSERATMSLILVGRGDELINNDFVERHGLGVIPYVVSTEVHRIYEISGTPYALFLDAKGAVFTKGTVNHLAHLESLLNASDAGTPSLEEAQGVRG
jgi:methylamine dehydrogenase accessory protein MauD